MNLSRRHLLSGGFAGLGVLGVSALTGCSTSTEPKSDTGAGDAKKLVLWMWPEGFDKQTLATVAKAQPSYNCLLYTSPSPRDKRQSRMPSSA